MTNKPETGHSYRVLVNDNFHYMDESERYELGVFATCCSAMEACRKIVDEYLLANYRFGMTNEALWESYTTFGEDPFIVSTDTGCRFSAWDYARQRCEEICLRGG
jgi:hypothetical protein